MLGMLPTHAKKNWQEWMATLTHAYNCTVSPVTGFSLYFLMFGRTPKLPLDIESGVTMVEQKQTSHQNYAQKLHSKLQWAYQKAQENNKKESECHKKYYDQKMRCINLKPDALIVVWVKALTGDHKIADQWENTPHQVISQLNDQPDFWVQPIDATTDNKIKILNQNLLFPLQTSLETEVEETKDEQNTALMKANLLIDVHFNN